MRMDHLTFKQLKYTILIIKVRGFRNQYVYTKKHEKNIKILFWNILDLMRLVAYIFYTSSKSDLFRISSSPDNFSR